MGTRNRHEEAETPGGQLLALVLRLSGELHPGRVLAADLDSVLDRDLGIDSLARVELLGRIERHFYVVLPEQAIAQALTLRDVLRAIEGAGAVVRGADSVDIESLEPAAQAVPVEAATLVEVLDWHRRRHPDRIHVRFYADQGQGQALSYGGLAEGARRVAAGLQQLGLEPASPVAIMLPTGADYLFCFLGILMAGAIPVPIYPPVSKARIEDHLQRQRAILGNCRASVMITLEEAIPFGRLLQSQLPELKALVTAERLGASGSAFIPPEVKSRDIAFLQYTSGSTGNPKGVVLSHANLLANIRAMGAAVQVGAGDVLVSWLPLYHDMGLIGSWLSSLYFALPLVLLSPLDFLARPRRWLWAIHRYRGTLSAAPNFAYEICLSRLGDEDLQGLDLSCWRGAFNGAEAVSARTVEAFCERFGAFGFRREALCPCYGLAESSVGLAFSPMGRGPRVDSIDRALFSRSGRAVPAVGGQAEVLRVVACGRALPGHEVRIVEPSGRELPERRQGRIQFRGPSACGGYYRNPEAGAALFDGDWLDTGDLGYLAEGELYLTGRSKDILIIAGRNIHPQELEEAVGRLEGIRKGNVAVFAVPDAASGTEALVVLAETRERDAGVLRGLRAQINALAVDLTGISAAELVLAPPGAVLKTSSGKIRRSACAALYQSGRLGRPAGLWLTYMHLGVLSLKGGLRRLSGALASQAFACYAWSLFWVLTSVVGSGICLLPGMGRRWRLIRWGAALLARLTGTPLLVEGVESVPAGGCILASNHASYLDGLVLAAVLPRPFRFVAKSELKQRPLVRYLLNRIGVEFVERFDMKKGAEDSRRICRAAVEGASFLFFPEATFTRAPGLRPFYMGAFMTAAEAGLPLIPLALRGTRSMLRDGSWFPRRGIIRIRIGAALRPGQQDAWETALGLRDGARAFILQHCGEPDLSGQAEPGQK